MPANHVKRRLQQALPDEGHMHVMILVFDLERCARIPWMIELEQTRLPHVESSMIHQG